MSDAARGARTMPQGEGDLRVDVVAGAAEPTTVRLARGRVFGPCTVGTHGEWRVCAERVQRTHGHMYFDGANLYLRSNITEEPFTANGAIVPLEWTLIRTPSTISLGEARLHYDAGATQDLDEAATRVMPVNGARVLRPTTGSPRAGEAAVMTRLCPIEKIPRSRASAGAAPAASGAPASPAAPPPPAREPRAEPQATLGTSQDSSAGARWRRASWAQKLTLVLLLPCAASVYVIFDDRAPQEDRAPPIGARSSASAARRTMEAPPAAPSDTAPQRPAATAPTALPPGPPQAQPERGKTLQRQAVDAVAAGDFERAAKMYEELAREEPGAQVYREAARILRAKAKKP